MSDEELDNPPPAVPEDMPPTPRPIDERFRDLAELEQEIRRRLRSNQRFLERFLDEDFIDDEGGSGDDEGGGDEEEL